MAGGARGGWRMDGGRVKKLPPFLGCPLGPEGEGKLSSIIFLSNFWWLLGLMSVLEEEPIGVKVLA